MKYFLFKFCRHKISQKLLHCSVMADISHNLSKNARLTQILLHIGYEMAKISTGGFGWKRTVKSLKPWLLLMQSYKHNNHPYVTLNIKIKPCFLNFTEYLVASKVATYFQIIIKTHKYLIHNISCWSMQFLRYFKNFNLFNVVDV